MDALISQVHPWLIVVAIVLATGFAAYLTIRSLKEGREISFWPPRIGSKVSDEKESESGTDKKEKTSDKIPQVVLSSEPIGMIRAMSGPSHGLSVLLTQQTRKLSFGRVADDYASVAINDVAMSRQHFVIKITPDGDHYQIQLFDLASSNGTIVNNKRIQIVDLKDGDIIRAGGSSFRVYLFESRTD